MVCLVVGNMGHRHKWFKQQPRGSHDFRRSNKIKNKMIIQILLIGGLLLLAYQYYQANSVNVIFTTLIQLPFLYKVVEGWIYWVIFLALAVGIW